MFCKKGALRSFAKFTGKHLCQSLYFNKVGLWHRCFPVNFIEFLRTPSYRTPQVAAPVISQSSGFLALINIIYPLEKTSKIIHHYTRICKNKILAASDYNYNSDFNSIELLLQSLIIKLRAQMFKKN